MSDTVLEDRSATIGRFLAANGWGAAAQTPLAGDASPRSYRRLDPGTGGPTAVLMDAPPERGVDVAPFLSVAGLLRERGLSAPAILDADPATGLVLMEDLGDALFARLAAGKPDCEAELYAAAVDVLVALHAEPPPPDLPPYTHADMAGRAALSVDWYLAGSEGRAEPGDAERLARVVAEALARLAPGHAVVALRDYHAENLVWLPERDGIRRVGLLDFQDAMAGHPAYDLVSLLEDVRRDVDPGLAAGMRARYIAATGVAPEPFAAACAMLAAQRNLRILGVFSRLCLHWGKPHYVDLLPRTWAHLMRDLDHPALGALRDVVIGLLPPPTATRMDRLKEAAGTWPMP